MTSIYKNIVESAKSEEQLVNLREVCETIHADMDAMLMLWAIPEDMTIHDEVTEYILFKTFKDKAKEFYRDRMAMHEVQRCVDELKDEIDRELVKRSVESIKGAVIE